MLRKTLVSVFVCALALVVLSGCTMLESALGVKFPSLGGKETPTAAETTVPDATEEAADAATTEPTAEPTPEPGGPYSFEMRTEDKTDAAGNKVFTVQYPFFSLPEVDDALQEAFLGIIDDLIGNADELETTVDGLVTVTVERNDAIVLSLMCEMGVYYDGAAHGMYDYTTYNWDARTLLPLSLADMLTDDAAGWQLMSGQCEAKMRALDVDQPAKEDIQGFEDSWFFEGVAPDSANFERYILRAEGVQFVFPPYQVGPFAMGMVRLTLSWEELSSVLAPDALAMVR